MSHFKKGDTVFVHTRGLSPQITGIYTITKYAWWSNYPYRIIRDGEETLIGKDEVTLPRFYITAASLEDTP